MKKPPSLGDDCAIDVQCLVESRLLVQANSGGGKSWAIRRLLEQTYGTCQHIVIDVEGEFHTLREKFDYVLAGQKGGDCPADTKSAALLAPRLLELNVSAIVDIYELGASRQRFVKLFLEALVNAPRDLWHPALIIVDEAQKFCPENAKAESAGAVAGLMTLGRKRGFCGVLATQRISDLSKSAAAECNNKLIGRCGLDVDMARAGKEIGFTKRDDIIGLRDLKPGEFYAFGPAFSVNGAARVRVGHVETPHPKAGQRAAPPTPPRAKIREVLGQLADLPAEAEAEARTAGELRARIADLEKQLRGKTVAHLEIRTVDKPVLADALVDRLESVTGELGRLLGEAKALRAKSQLTSSEQQRVARQEQEARVVERRVYPSKHAAKVREFARGSIPIGEAAMLRALIQYPAGLRRDQLTVLTGYKRSTRDAYIARLRDRGLIETNLVLVIATDAARRVVPDAEPLPTGPALRDWWMAQLPSGEGAVLDELVKAYPAAVRRDALDLATGFRRSTRDAYLNRLAARELVEDVSRGEVRASATLFEVNP